MRPRCRLFPVLVVVAVVGGCASSPPAPDTPTKAKRARAAPVLEEQAPDHPRTWDEVSSFYGRRCPTPDFVLDTPQTRTIGGTTWTVKGSVAVREGRWTGPLTLGVLGAIKDATPATRKNLVAAKAAFDKAGVDLIVCNGDVAEAGEIHDVANLLVDVFGDERPVLVHAGNSEWLGGFTDTFMDTAKAHPNFFDLNLIKDLDIGGVHLLSLPGWSVRAFVKEGGCRYGDDDVAALGARAAALAARGELAILTAHGPPRGPDARSLDRTFDDGNVGDAALATLLQQGTLRFGLFGHILEAGGRATDDATTHKPLALPMKKATSSLFVNVGSASSVGVQLLAKKTSRGLAAIVVVDPAGQGSARVTFVPLSR